MPKHTSPLLCSLLALASVGCAMNRPPIMPADQAMATFHGRLAESCGEKHLDRLPAEKLNVITQKIQYEADTNTRQIIDLDAYKQCGSDQRTGVCFNTGVIQATIQTDSLPELVKTVCGQPAIGGE